MADAIKKGMRIPEFKAGDLRTPLSAEAMAPIVATCNAFLNLEVKRVPATLAADGTFKAGAEVAISEQNAVITLYDAPGGADVAWNEVQSFTATCPAGTTGATNTVTVAANTIAVSADDGVGVANGYALDLATALAMAGLTCTPVDLLNDRVACIKVLSDNSLVIAGKFTTVAGIGRLSFAYLEQDFTLKPQCFKFDQQFTGAGSGAGMPLSAIDTDPATDDVYASTPLLSRVDINSWAWARLKSDGTFPTFSPAGTGSTRYWIAWQKNQGGGLVLIGGTFSGGLKYYNPAGTLNAGAGTFGGAHGVVSGCPDGAGSFYVWDALLNFSDQFCQVNLNLTLTSFDPRSHGLNDVPAAGAVQLDAFGVPARLIIVGPGLSNTPGGVTANGIAGLLPTSGAFDTTFYTYAHNGFGVAGVSVFQSCIAVDPATNKIYIGGKFTSYNSISCGANILRLNSDGSLDTGWTVGTNATVYCITVEPDGNVLVGGDFTTIGPSGGVVTRKYLARLDGSGNVL